MTMLFPQYAPRPKRPKPDPNRPKPRFHRGNDPWGRSSYSIPTYALAGASNTGSGGPAPSADVREELNRLRAEVLRPLGIRSRLRATASGNCCMCKVWVVVSADDFGKALGPVEAWLDDNKSTTSYIHDAKE